MVEATPTGAALPQIGAPFVARLSAVGAAILVRLAAWTAADSPRLALWAPVALGGGAAAYLLADSEPAVVFAPLLIVLSVALAMRFERLRAAAVGAAIFFAGFALADFRALAVEAPILGGELNFVTVVGRIVSIDEAAGQRRLVLEVGEIETLAPVDTPARVRVSWRGKSFDSKPGDVVSIRASLSPPPAPAAPGGFDFARQLYFNRIGAVGFAVSPPQLIVGAPRSFGARIAAFIEQVRLDLSRRILVKAPGEGGTIVAAVVTGKRAAISDEAEAAFRDSGLAHLLSISGLHMGLATGLVFFGVRALLALFESIALTQPIKKWAALAALASGAAYLVVSGGAWPAQRAYIMSSIFFIAILSDRRALSLRNVAIAAFVIIILTPEAVLHPGFQMSFAAVTALIAAYEWASGRADPTRSFSILARLRRYVVGIAITDTIAAAATAPFSLYHFNRTANFGLAANIISIPLMGFVVMPAAIVAIALAPFGLDEPFWRLAAGGVDIMLALARWTTELPGAVTVFPHWPPAALGVLTIGGLWLCLMSAPWRLFGVAALPAAAALIAAEPHPVLYVSDQADNVGCRYSADGGGSRLAVLDRARSRFDVNVWMEHAGVDAETQRPAKLSDVAPCDESGCVIMADGALMAVVKRRSGLDDDCRRADLVIALFVVTGKERANCGAQLIDRRDAWRDGAHSAYVRNGAIRIQSAASLRGERPWS